MAKWSVVGECGFRRFQVVSLENPSVRYTGLTWDQAHEVRAQLEAIFARVPFRGAA